MFNFTIANPSELRTPSYQRETDLRKVESIASRFDEDSFGAVTVARRPDGHLYVIDGLHRNYAAIKIGLPQVTVRVIDGLTEEQEAAKFLKLNETKTVNAVDKFKAQVIAGFREQVEINQLVDAAGWSVSATKADGTISGVKALEFVYRGAGELPAALGGVLLEATLDSVTQAWQMNADGTTATMLKAVGKVLGRYSRQVDRSVLVRRLRDTTPANLLGKARGLGDERNISTVESMSDVIVNTYNARLRKNTLPYWEIRK